MAGIVPTRRLIVADPGLTGLEGHHLHYSEGVAAAAAARGLVPLVLAGAGFTGSIDGGRIACEARFSARYQTSGGGGWPRQALFAAASLLPDTLAGAVGPPIRRLRRRLRRDSGGDPFGRELAAALAVLGCTGRDIVLLHSVSAANLASLTEAVPADAIGHLLIVLRRTREDMDTDDPGPAPIAAIARRLREHFAARLTLYADTALLADGFARLTGQTVHAVPPPVAVPPMIAAPGHAGPVLAGSGHAGSGHAGPGHSGSGDAGPADSGTGLAGSGHAGPAVPHLVFIGGARLEKGFHHLPAIVAACRGHARFTLHCGPVDTAADPLIQRAHRTLRGLAGPDLSLIERPLPTPDYWTLLNSADLVLLPYDAAAYGPRSSGILVESLALGIPALVPAGCWMEHAGGTERTEIMAGVEDAAAATRRALARLPALRAAARAGQAAWRDSHTAEALLSALLAPISLTVAHT